LDTLFLGDFEQIYALLYPLRPVLSKAKVAVSFVHRSATVLRILSGEGKPLPPLEIDNGPSIPLDVTIVGNW
jgi:hypothetical protein